MKNFKTSHRFLLLFCHNKRVIVQSLSHVWLFVTPWTAACQASLSFTISRSLLQLMSKESVMPPAILSSAIPFSCLQSFPASGSFLMRQLFESGGQSIGASASASVLQMNIPDWFPFELTALISLLSKGLSTVFSNTTVWSHTHHTYTTAYRYGLWHIHIYKSSLKALFN